MAKNIMDDIMGMKHTTLYLNEAVFVGGIYYDILFNIEYVNFDLIGVLVVVAGTPVFIPWGNVKNITLYE